MPGFDHGSAVPPEVNSQEPTSRHTRYGLFLFFLYLLLYGGFVLLNAFAPSLMEQTPLAGINLAILYGLALIGVAFIFSLFYDWLCRLPLSPGHEDKGEAGDL